jgi:tetratricopeptide (TPR) repeat protein
LHLANGDLAVAARLFEDVEPRFRRELPANHITFTSLLSEQALLAQARGEIERAIALSDRAVALAEADPQARAWLERCLERRSALALHTRRLEAAASDAARAVGLALERIDPSSRSSHVGRAYVTLGRALTARGQRDEARAALASAVEHLESTLGKDHPEARNARQLLESVAAGRSGGAPN